MDKVYNNKIPAGRYELKKQIGEGGCSVVYLARDMNVGRFVAVKAEKEPDADKAGLVLKNEMEILKKLSHPMLPVIFDFFHEDRWYLVMEYIAGDSLHNVIEREGAVTEKQACEWAKQLLGLLAYMHGRKPAVIYRDLKPENIIVCADRSLKVVDFGTAFRAEYDYENTCAKIRAGTIGYAAPEQLLDDCLGAVADERSDIYTFGALLYHMLTGLTPPARPNGSLSVGSINKGLTNGIERIVRKCTELDASMRYQSVKEVQTDLEQSKNAFSIRSVWCKMKHRACQL